MVLSKLCDYVVFRVIDSGEMVNKHLEARLGMVRSCGEVLYRVSKTDEVIT